MDHTYTDVLPTANFKLGLTPDLIARFAAGETMTRADYSALAGSIQLGAPPPPCVRPPRASSAAGSGGNPNLKPIISSNYDAGTRVVLRAALAARFDVFYMDLKNYVAFGTAAQDLT